MECRTPPPGCTDRKPRLWRGFLSHPISQPEDLIFRMKIVTFWALNLFATSRCLRKYWLSAWVDHPSDHPGSRLRNSWVFCGLLVDPKGDPQEPLREAAWNRRFSGRNCFRKTGAEVKFFKMLRHFSCRLPETNTYYFSRCSAALFSSHHAGGQTGFETGEEFITWQVSALLF